MYLSPLETVLDASQTEGDLGLDGTIGGLDQGFGRPMTVEIAQQFTTPLQRQELIIIQVGRLSFKPEAVLYRLTDLRREVAFGRVPTPGTDFDFSPMFDHFNLDRRNVKHLPPFVPARLNRLQVGPTLTTDRVKTVLFRLAISWRNSGDHTLPISVASIIKRSQFETEELLMSLLPESCDSIVPMFIRFN